MRILSVEERSYEVLGAPGSDPAIWRDKVVIEVEPTDERFEFDCDMVAHKLFGIGGIVPYTGQLLVDRLMSEVERNRQPWVVLRSDKLTVKFGIDQHSVGNMYDRHDGELQWWQNGTNICGPLGHWSKKPQLIAEIATPESAALNRPIVDPELKALIHWQARVISEAFQPQLQLQQ